MKRALHFLPLICPVLLCGAGCSDSLKEFPVAKTTGIVLCQGKPVRSAMVFFTPVANGKSAEVGKPGFSFTGEDGRFVLSAYGEGDGAVIGRNKVRVTTNDEFPCPCVGDEVRDLTEVEVKADGPNEFEIVLPPRSGHARPARNPFDDSEDPKLSAAR